MLTFTCGRLAGRWYGYRSYATHLDGQQLVVVHSEPSGELAGTGQQAWTQLWAIAAVRALTDVAVFSRARTGRDAFAARAAADLGVPARAVETAWEAGTEPYLLAHLLGV